MGISAFFNGDSVSCCPVHKPFSKADALLFGKPSGLHAKLNYALTI
jgi:hypothetical protein